MDIALIVVQDPLTGQRSFDFQMDGADLLADAGLQTAVSLSLFCNRQAMPDDALPFASDDPGGWWADVYLAGNEKPSNAALTGSRLWLLEGAPATLVTARRAQLYAREALQWLLDQKIASGIAVRTQWIGRNELAMAVTISQKDPRGVSTAFEFDFIWSPVFAQRGAVSGIYSDAGSVLGTEDSFEIGTEPTQGSQGEQPLGLE